MARNLLKTPIYFNLERIKTNRSCICIINKTQRIKKNLIEMANFIFNIDCVGLLIYSSNSNCTLDDSDVFTDISKNDVLEIQNLFLNSRKRFKGIIAPSDLFNLIDLSYLSLSSISQYKIPPCKRIQIINSHVLGALDSSKLQIPEKIKIKL